MPSKAWLTWPPWTLLMMTVKSWLTSWLSWNKYWCTDWGVSNLATFLLPSSLLWQATFQPPLSVSLATFLFLSLFPPPLSLTLSCQSFLFPSFPGNLFYVSPLSPGNLSRFPTSPSSLVQFPCYPLCSSNFSALISLCFYLKISLFRRSILVLLSILNQLLKYIKLASKLI